MKKMVFLVLVCGMIFTGCDDFFSSSDPNSGRCSNRREGGCATWGTGHSTCGRERCSAERERRNAIAEGRTTRSAGCSCPR